MVSSSPPPLEQIRLDIDTNYYGTLHMVRAFAPILGANGGGAILNVLSQLSFVSFLGATGYSAAKAAAWSLTNGVRLELAGQGTFVTGVALGATDTDMTAAWDIDKNAPADVVRQALDGIEAGRLEVLADADTAATKALLSADPAEMYPMVRS
jgi:NAD(P)-dependent dehydrogenase (short-subunit alcohol dehydrogenase family)